MWRSKHANTSNDEVHGFSSVECATSSILPVTRHGQIEIEDYIYREIYQGLVTALIDIKASLQSQFLQTK